MTTALIVALAALSGAATLRLYEHRTRLLAALARHKGHHVRHHLIYRLAHRRTA